MTAVNIQSGLIENVFLNQLRLRSETRTLAGNITLVKQSPTLQYMDPGGAARTVTLPAEADSDGLVFVIVNRADAAEVITVQDDGTTTIVTPTQNEVAVCFCDGVGWSGFVATEA